MTSLNEHLDLLEAGVRVVTLRNSVMRSALKNVAGAQSLPEAVEIATLVLSCIDTIEDYRNYVEPTEGEGSRVSA